MEFYSPIYLFLLHDRQLERAKSNIDTGNGHMLKITVIHGQNHKGSGPFYFFTLTYCMRVSAPMKSFIDLTFISWMPHRPKAYMFHSWYENPKSDKRYINLFVLLGDSKTMGSVFKQKTGGP